MMFATLPLVGASSRLITLTTSSSSYTCMQEVGLYANLSSNGAPISNSLVAVEVDWQGSTSWHPILLRSLKGSQNPNPALFDTNLKVVSTTPVNINWQPQSGFIRGTEGYFNITLVNSGNAVTGMIAWSVLDAASVPLGANAYGAPLSPITINPGITTVLGSSSIPSWAAVGAASIYVNVFSDAPLNGGYPIINETSTTFQVESSFGYTAKTLSLASRESLDYSGASDPSGLYNFSYRIPPDPVFGNYTVSAASAGAAPTDSVFFQVKPMSTPPQATFTYSPLAPYVNGTVSFDASGSYSYNGTITTYNWNWGDGSKNSTSSPTITHVFKAQGAFTVTLNVTDSQGLWGVYEEPLSVSGPTPPVASFTFTPNPTWINASTKFDASTSTPGWNGTGHPPIISYIWSYGDGTPLNTTSNAVSYHKFRKTGNFLATLTVKDTRGWNSTTAQNVPVDTSGTSPQAIFAYSPSTPYVNGTVSFDASGSFSYYGTITNYKWNWGDGSPQQSTSSTKMNHTYTSARTFTVTLNVTDSMNLWGITQKPVKVSPLTHPTASFTVAPNPTWINATTQFNATSSAPGWNGTGNPPIVKYIWNFGDGAKLNTTSKVTNHQFRTLGNFLTTLTVEDTRGWYSNATSVGVDVTNVTLIVDIAVTNVSFPAPPTGLYQIAPNYYQPYQGWAGNILVTVFNNGTTAQSFNVTVKYSNGTSYSVGTQQVTKLASLNSTVVSFAWNTSQLEPTMNYTITANATILPGETNTKNNQYSIIARVKGPGDINGDGVVSAQDFHILASNWTKKVPPGDPRADLNGDGVINALDFHILARNWLRTYHG